MARRAGRDGLPVYGGPLDGTVASPAGGHHRWLDAEGRAHREPGPGRSLYLREPTRWRAAAGHRRCPGCGALVAPEPGTGRAPGACPLCAAEG